MKDLNCYFSESCFVLLIVYNSHIVVYKLLCYLKVKIAYNGSLFEQCLIPVHYFALQASGDEEQPTSGTSCVGRRFLLKVTLSINRYDKVWST